jgi:xanthine dehydrogenase accessory factor
MKEILNDMDLWFADGRTDIALATVVLTWGSSPRRIGAKMAVTADGRISGSVSGGCVEGAVVEVCSHALNSGKAQLLHYGVADEKAWDVGLACGGNIDVFVEVLDEKWYRFFRHIVLEAWAGVVVTVIRGPQELLGRKAAYGRDGERTGSLGADLDIELQSVFSSIHQSQRISLRTDLEIFVDLFQPPPVLVMIGGVHVAIALTRQAKSVDYQTVVIDPRRSFGSEIRFPDVDYLLQEWPKKAFEELMPTPDMAVALLTHDPKIDDQALKILLDSEVFYIGALGSRKTHANRKDRLREMGFSDSKIARIYAPIGLDIGADNPEEIALAIMAEIIGVRRGIVQSSN